MLVGAIADTHGYVDPRVADAFAGVDAIVVAGDIGGTHVLDALREMAPVRAVYGNNDEKLGGLGLRLHEDVVLGGVTFHLEHQLPHAAFEWYKDLRRYGSVPHSGFGIGVERTLAWLAGLDHVRETIPFPRMLYRLRP